MLMERHGTCGQHVFASAHEYVPLGSPHFLRNRTVFFDDGYHCPIPDNLKSNAEKILIIHKCTGLDKYKSSYWADIKRFVVPMPD